MSVVRDAKRPSERPKSRELEVDLSRLLRFAPKMRNGVTCNWWLHLEVNELRKESVPLRSTKIIERVCTSLRASLDSKRQSSSLVVLFGVLRSNENSIRDKVANLPRTLNGPQECGVKDCWIRLRVVPLDLSLSPLCVTQKKKPAKTIEVRWLAICVGPCTVQWICRGTLWYVPLMPFFDRYHRISERHVFQGSKWSGRQTFIEEKRQNRKEKKRKRNELLKTIKWLIAWCSSFKLVMKNKWTRSSF